MSCTPGFFFFFFFFFFPGLQRKRDLALLQMGFAVGSITDTTLPSSGSPPVKRRKKTKGTNDILVKEFCCICLAKELVMSCHIRGVGDIIDSTGI